MLEFFMFLTIFNLSMSEHKFASNCDTELNLDSIFCSESNCSHDSVGSFEELNKAKCHSLCEENNDCEYFKWFDDKKNKLRKCFLMSDSQCAAFSDQVLNTDQNKDDKFKIFNIRNVIHTTVILPVCLENPCVPSTLTMTNIIFIGLVKDFQHPTIPHQ